MFVSGQFGYVYKGFLKLDEQKEDVEVAVKTLKSWSGKSSNQRSVSANIKAGFPAILVLIHLYYNLS